MTGRDAALANAEAHFHSGAFLRDLARRVAIRSESQDPAQSAQLRAYVADEMSTSLSALGFDCRVFDNPLNGTGCGPILVATRHERADLPTVLMYGHGDVIRGQDASWTRGQGPWALACEGDRLYGRGAADNKGQHSINIAALAQVIAARGGRLGFNATWLIETGEETGSPGLAEFCAQQRNLLAADVLIASDGPRLRAALAGLQAGGGPGDPEIDNDWGEPDQTPIERVLAWNALEVLAMRTGNPDFPVNAIPAHASAHLQLRFVVGTDTARLREHVTTHLREHGFADVEVSEPVVMAATRLDPDNAWVRFAMASIEATLGRPPVLLPNLGGSLPNDVFADGLGLPTVWVPHSYPACSQHAPDEHLLVPVVRQALQLMTGLFWDLGEQAATLPRISRSAPRAAPR